mmetsp:Transcript_16206/g.33675  ORF Transcript_16206/g.33675 Transcript_16206/m.33675 type:complete len:208 (+) Transcript_16206:867-1490(+)
MVQQQHQRKTKPLLPPGIRTEIIPVQRAVIHKTIRRRIILSNNNNNNNRLPRRETKTTFDFSRTDIPWENSSSPRANGKEGWPLSFPMESITRLFLSTWERPSRSTLARTLSIHPASCQRCCLRNTPGRNSNRTAAATIPSGRYRVCPSLPSRSKKLPPRSPRNKRRCSFERRTIRPSKNAFWNWSRPRLVFCKRPTRTIAASICWT